MKMDTYPANQNDLLPRLHGLEQALDSLGQALVVLDHDGGVIYATPPAKNIVCEKDGLALADGKLRAFTEGGKCPLREMLDTMMSGDGDFGAPQTKPEILVQRPSGKLPYKLRINRLQSHHNATGSAGGALVMIHDTHTNYMAWYERLQWRFNLTPRECECTMLLTEGYSMDEVAERMGISKQTLRQHLKHAFHKTGTRKQHELVGLVLQMQRKR
jgi:DNA-binding CsgD family transcriptional regulator